MRRYSLFSMMVAIAFLAFGSIESAYATTTTLDVANTGMACESLGGVWNAAISTCTLSNSLTILAGDTLTVTNGVTLELSTNANLINQGDITNNGIITIEGNSGNSGQLRNQNNAAFTNSGTGTITITGITGSSGRLLNSDSATFSNSGTITITGTSLQSGWLFNRDTADFTNSGTIILTGIADESGRLTNDQGSASFTNSGTITLTGTTELGLLLSNLKLVVKEPELVKTEKFLTRPLTSPISALVPVRVIVPEFVKAAEP